MGGDFICASQGAGDLYNSICKLCGGIHYTISRLKKVLWPNFCVGPLLQLLGILQYACGLKFGPALNLNQNPFFEMTSNLIIARRDSHAGKNNL